MKHLTTGLLFIALSTDALAGVYEFRIRRFGEQGLLSDCQSNKGQIAASFESSLVGGHVVSADCTLPDDTSPPSLTLVYSATSPVAIWDSEEQAVLYSGQYAPFTNLADCRADAPREAQLMQDLTGLKPFLVQCYLTSKLGVAHYRLRLLAVGQSTWQKGETSISINDDVTFPDSFLKSMESVGSDIPMTVVRWGFQPYLMGHALTAQYYQSSTDPMTAVRINAHISGYVGDQAACQSKANKLAQRLSNDSLSHAGCLPTSKPNQMKLALAWWSVDLEKRDVYEKRLLTGPFNARAQCESEAARVESELTSDSSFVAAFCSQNQKGAFQVELLTLK